MKILKLGLRLWITVTSLMSFLVGWVMLAHAPKPNTSNSAAANPASSVAPMPTLAPLPPLMGNNNNSDFQNQNQFQFNDQPQIIIRPRPLFSTGGS